MTERRHVTIPEDELKDLIRAEVAQGLEMAVDRLILEVSKSFFKKILWAIILALMSFLLGKHMI